MKWTLYQTKQNGLIIKQLIISKLSLFRLRLVAVIPWGYKHLRRKFKLNCLQAEMSPFSRMCFQWGDLEEMKFKIEEDEWRCYTFCEVLIPQDKDEFGDMRWISWKWKVRI